MKFTKPKGWLPLILVCAGSINGFTAERALTPATLNVESIATASGSTSGKTGAGVMSAGHYNDNALERTVTGTVKDENSVAMPGVNIAIKGTTQGTITDAEGRYSLSVPDGNVVLLFSFVGYMPQEVMVDNQSVVDVQLFPDIKTLSELVVIGYGEQKKQDLTGAVASVKADELKNLPVASVADALQGRVAGVVITPDDGNPRASANIIVRGPVNINGRGPLYVVDGVPFTGTGAAFNFQDVESIEVLKDASAAAIYGTLASGGVILVTTKRGKSGKLSVTGNMSYGTRKVVNLPTLLQRDDYIRARKIFNPDVDFGDPSQYSSLPDTDWNREIFKTGKEQNYTVALSGGNDVSTFYTSVNYNRVDGPKINNYNERFSLRLNSDHAIGKRLKLGQTFFASTLNEDPVQNGGMIFRSTPLMRVYDVNNVNGGWGMAPAGFNGANPVGLENVFYRKNRFYELNLSSYLEGRITDELKVRVNAGFNQSGRDDNYYDLPYDWGIVKNFQENFGQYMRQDRNYLANMIVTYNKLIGDHSISAMVGYEARKATGADVGGNSQGPFVPFPQGFNMAKSDANARPTGSRWQGDRYLSQFARLNYSFLDRYLFTANIRRDGSALKFGPNNKFGVFPSVSAGWKINEEQFMSSLDAVTQLKLRVSYGVLGNEPNDNYLFTTGYRFAGDGNGYAYDFGDGTRRLGAYIEPRLANHDIRWETVATANIGIDGSLFNNSMYFSVDYYNRNTNDMIYRVPLPQSAGVGAEVQKNIGKMNNRGVEVLVGIDRTIGKLRINAAVNGAYNRNELISLIPGIAELSLQDGNSNQAYGASTISRSEPGQPLGQFYGYLVDGIYKDNEGIASRPEIAAAGGYRPQAGDLIYRDLNGDNKIDEKDKTYIGNPWPKLNYGINLGAEYAGFDVKMFFNGVHGVDIYNAAQTYTQTFYGDYNTTADIFGASFFGTNGLTSKPRVGTASDLDKNGNYSVVSSYHVQSGAFLRLQNIQVGYSLSPAVLEKIGFRSMRVFVMGGNLFTITKYKGVNPQLAGDVRARGIDRDFDRYPLSRLMSLGVNFEL